MDTELVFYRKCPICENKFCNILHTQNFIVPENSILPSSYNLVCCKKCGFVYADVSVGQSVYDLYYKELSKYEDKNISSGTGINHCDKIRLRKTAEEIARLLNNKSKSILDFGCGNGGLLLELQDLGYEKIAGIDPSAVCVKNIQENKINASIGSLFNHGCKNKFDLIIFTHVFEHICDLKTALQNIKPLLNKDGLVYIETPDASRYYKFYKVPYYYFDVEHINHFNEISLSNLLKLNGFEEIKFGKKEFLFSEKEYYPAVWIVGQKLEPSAGNIIKDDSVKKSVVKYIEMSKKGMKIEKFKKLEEIKNSREPVVIWGAGNYAMRVLADSCLKECNIKFFIDKDSKKTGLKIKNIEIKSPEALVGFDGTIIICSAIFSLDIKKEIAKLGFKNRIIIL